jgi:hypothetical protein
MWGRQGGEFPMIVFSANQEIGEELTRLKK